MIYAGPNVEAVFGEGGNDVLRMRCSVICKAARIRFSSLSAYSVCASFSGMPIFTIRSTNVLSNTFGC